MIRPGSIRSIAGGGCPPLVGYSVLVIACLATSSPAALGQGLEGDPFATHLQGPWVGRGVYDGNELSLTRSWTFQLGTQFLRGEMGVSMPNGATFGSLTYWKMTRSGSYEVVWLDGMGRIQTINAHRDPGSGLVYSEFLDELAEGGPETRRWEFERAGPDSYVERLFLRDGEGWRLLTEWIFQRVPDGNGDDVRRGRIWGTSCYE